MRLPRTLLLTLAGAALLAACNPNPANPTRHPSRAADAAPHAASAAAAASAGPPAQIIEWDAQRDGNPHSYDIGGLHITLHTKTHPDGPPSPVIHISAPGRPDFEYEGVAGLDNAVAHFAVGRFDRSVDAPQVMFTAYSGGAHCCTDVRFFIPGASGWTTVEAGEWDGDGVTAYPTDVDGDGVLDMQMFDDRFDYAFGSHADSREPPRIFNVAGGHWVDVSTHPGFAPLFQHDMTETQRDCLAHSNPACAAFVADASRLGRYAWAWPIMMANYDRHDDWELPDGCRVPIPAGSEACPEAQTVHFTAFPPALEYFLHDMGYGPPASPAR